jgi:hypothetical protein
MKSQFFSYKSSLQSGRREGIDEETYLGIQRISHLLPSTVYRLPSTPFASLLHAVLFLSLLSLPLVAQTIRVNPTGVNVNTSGATTVFLTFGQVTNYRAADATFCGELIPAAPGLGLRCNPATVFGTLPARLDLSRGSGNQGFTDIMSIPPSIARRAYQAALSGAESSFFYVRRFVSLTNAPDQFVVVTCRLSGGGARTPFALTDVKVSFAVPTSETATLFLRPGEKPPAVNADIVYTGTGRLRGRWEIVLPSEEPPAAEDLLTEASLPVEQRRQQRRYTQLSRFNEFLPPTGRFTLPGPDVTRLPVTIEGAYQILLRIEATDDKEGDSNLAAVGVGAGTINSGAVAGFPMPVLRYFVGNAAGLTTAPTLALLLPADQASSLANRPLDFIWTNAPDVALYRLEIADDTGQLVLDALLPAGVNRYRAPTWVRDQRTQLQWRVVTIDTSGATRQETTWRRVRLVN